MIGQWNKGDRVRARREIYRGGMSLIDEGQIGTVVAVPEPGEPSSLLVRVEFPVNDGSGEILVGWSVVDGIDRLLADLELAPSHAGGLVVELDEREVEWLHDVATEYAIDDPDDRAAESILAKLPPRVLLVVAAVAAIIAALAPAPAEAMRIEPGERYRLECPDLYGGGYKALPFDEPGAFLHGGERLPIVDVSRPPFAEIANAWIIDYRYGVRVITSDGDVREIYGGSRSVRYRDRCEP